MVDTRDAFMANSVEREGGLRREVKTENDPFIYNYIETVTLRTLFLASGWMRILYDLSGRKI